MDIQHAEHSTLPAFKEKLNHTEVVSQRKVIRIYMLLSRDKILRSGEHKEPS